MVPFGDHVFPEGLVHGCWVEIAWFGGNGLGVSAEAGYDGGGEVAAAGEAVFGPGEVFGGFGHFGYVVFGVGDLRDSYVEIRST